MLVAGTSPGLCDKNGDPLVAWVDLFLLADQVGKPSIDPERFVRILTESINRLLFSTDTFAELVGLAREEKAFQNVGGPAGLPKAYGCCLVARYDSTGAPDDTELLVFLTGELGLSRDDAWFLIATESL